MSRVDAAAQTVTPDSVAALAEVVRQADTDGLTLSVAGAGTKSHWGGNLTAVDLRVHTTRLAGVVRHDPADLVVTVRAGTALRDLQAELALAGQRLALDAGSVAATVGGILATGEAGPLRLRHGTGRDLLLGVAFVRADGVLARSGGRVVKNVAGYDVGRLLCGSYGTLGILTEVTLRCHPLPAARAWVSCHVTAARVGEAAVALVRSRLDLSAVEVDLRGKDGSLCALVEGSRDGVAERAAAAARLMGEPAAVTDEQPPWWGSYPFTAGEVGLKVVAAPSELTGILDLLANPDLPADAASAVRGSAGTGVVYAALATEDPAVVAERVAALRARLAAEPGRGGSCVVLTAPAHLRDGLDLWGPVVPGLHLMRRVKEQFDPRGRLAAGRFVGGI